MSYYNRDKLIFVLMSSISTHLRNQFPQRMEKTEILIFHFANRQILMPHSNIDRLKRITAACLIIIMGSIRELCKLEAVDMSRENIPKDELILYCEQFALQNQTYSIHDNVK